MNIGKLNRRIEVLEFVAERDEYGGEVGEWKSVERLWARIEPVSGTEYFQSQTVNAETVVKITIRYNPKIDVMNRIRYGETTYEIIGVSDEKTAHKATILNCKEMVNNGLQRKATESESECPRWGQDSEGTQRDGRCCVECSNEGSKSGWTDSTE